MKKGTILKNLWAGHETYFVYMGFPVRTERTGYRGRLCELLELTPLGKIGLMNPEYLEYLTGFPIGWTELDA